LRGRYRPPSRPAPTASRHRQSAALNTASSSMLLLPLRSILTEITLIPYGSVSWEPVRIIRSRGKWGNGGKWDQVFTLLQCGSRLSICVRYVSGDSPQRCGASHSRDPARPATNSL
jgi:hypothetical protein